MVMGGEAGRLSVQLILIFCHYLNFTFFTGGIILVQAWCSVITGNLVRFILFFVSLIFGSKSGIQ